MTYPDFMTPEIALVVIFLSGCGISYFTIQLLRLWMKIEKEIRSEQENHD